MTAILYSIDPGATGAIARFIDGRLDRLFDPAAKSLAQPLANLLLDDLGNPDNAVTVAIERVNGLPGQSGPGAFNFGQSYGELLGVCVGLGVGYSLHPPVTWKWAMGLRRNGGDTPAKYKMKSILMARELWPETTAFARAKDEGRAEAALLGQYVLTQGLML